MKYLPGRACAAALLALSVIFGARAQTNEAPFANSAYVEFGKFTPPAAGEFVEVNLDSNIIAMAARLGKQSEPEITEVLAGLQRVRVNVIGLDDGNREEVQGRLKTIRGELDRRGWARVVTVQGPGQDIAAYIKTRGEEAVEGIVVTIVEGGKQAVLVNIVGDIKPEKLVVIGERFDVDPLKKL